MSSAAAPLACSWAAFSTLPSGVSPRPSSAAPIRSMTHRLKPLPKAAEALSPVRRSFLLTFGLPRTLVAGAREFAVLDKERAVAALRRDDLKFAVRHVQ